MRALISVVGIALLAAGCFNPDVKTGGFKCDPTVPDACPTGFYCVNQLCVNHPGTSSTGGNGGDDMSVGDDMTMSTPNGPEDLAMPPLSPPDLAKPIVPPDLAQPVVPPDLSQPNTCAHDLCTTGAKLDPSCSACANIVCTEDSFCCSSKWDSQCVMETADCDPADQCP